MAAARQARAGWPRACARPLERLHALVEEKCSTLDLAPDLAQDIGSGKWFRGLATMLGLSLAAISFWPNLTAVEAAAAMPVDRPVRDEFRSQMIMPLAQGGDSGRHMGATALVMPLASAPERPMIQLVATLGEGDSFIRMLQRAGVGEGDAARVAGLVANTIALDKVASGTQFDITMGKRSAPGVPRPLDKLDFRASFDLAVAVDRQGGALALTRKPILVDSTPLRIRGVVGSSLYQSARAAGAPLEAIQQYLQAIDGRIDIENGVNPGDQFDMVIAYKRSAEGERQAGQLLYAGLQQGGKQVVQLMRWGAHDEFFEASGLGQQQQAQPQASRFFMPVSGGRLTSGFGPRRHPILGFVRMHAGDDYAVPYGTPIHAAADGIVTFAGRHGGHGNFVRLDNGGGLGTGYAHMSQIAAYPGERVQAGQVIGYVGSTGLSTGPHLHFEVYENGRPVDPMGVHFAVQQLQPTISGAELAAFHKRLEQLTSVVPGAALQRYGAGHVAAISATPVRQQVAFRD